MGSLVYARAAKARGDKVAAMISVETIGCYSDKLGSQRYPKPFNLFYPSAGNFIAFVGNTLSADLVRRIVGRFRSDVRFPSEGAALLGSIEGVGWSDHWSFWQCGYHAVMVTDTAPFRYDWYHTANDTPDKIDYDRTARVVEGLEIVVRDLLKGD
jgi:Zn-dependent M28 family amino/carboxypeptidase